MEWVILTTVVLYIVLAVVFGRFTGMIAKSKGYDVQPWVIAGICLGPIAMLAVGLMDSANEVYERSQSVKKHSDRERHLKRAEQVEAAEKARQARQDLKSLSIDR